MDNHKIIYPEDCSPVARHGNYIPVPRKAWPQHDIIDLELIYVVNGEMTAQDSDHPLTILNPGEVLLIRANKPCDLLYRSGNPAVISCLHFELIPDASYENGDYAIGPFEPWVVPTDVVMLELFRKQAATFSGHSMYRQAMISTITKEIWLRLMEHAQKANRPTVLDSRMERMVEYLRENLAEPITRQDLAREFGLTPEHVNFLFKEQLGVSPGELLKRERIRHATRLLRDGRLSITEIAQSAGYTDPLYFSRTFRKFMGVSPSRYRQA